MKFKGSKQRSKGIPRYLDGKPYYCRRCGAGYAELMTCLEIGCQLETVEEAEKRRDNYIKKGVNKRIRTKNN